MSHRLFRIKNKLTLVNKMSVYNIYINYIKGKEIRL